MLNLDKESLWTRNQDFAKVRALWKQRFHHQLHNERFHANAALFMVGQGVQLVVLRLVYSLQLGLRHVRRRHAQKVHTELAEFEDHPSPKTLRQTIGSQPISDPG